MTILKIASNPVHAKLIDANREVRMMVSELLSYEVQGSEFMTRRAGWDGRSSFFSFKTDSFPAGFVPRVHAMLVKQGYRVKLIRKALPEPLGPEIPHVDEFGHDDERYSYQLATIAKLVRFGMGIAQCATGCHAKGQQILMFDGSVKNVEDVKVGDQLMGPDSTPRNVLHLHRGKEEMFRITPKRYGNPFVVNAGHILSLEQTKLPDGRWESIRNGEWLNISVREYLEQSKTFKHIWKMHRSKGIDFESEGELPLDPYLLGLFLGDGHSKRNGNKSESYSISITTIDPEIKDWLCGWAIENDHRITVNTKSGTKAETLSIVRRYRSEYGGTAPLPNLVSKALVDMNLQDSRSHDKHIPDVYKTGSRETRLKILAGLLDTDGHMTHNYFEFVSKSPQLANDVAFIARSLGFGVHVVDKTPSKGRYAGSTFRRVTINGHVDEIPTQIKRKQAEPRAQKKDVHLSGFSVESVGEDDYYGFEVDDDNLYLMDDFTITHNSGKSRVARLAYARINRKTLFLTTRGALMYQFRDACIESFGEKEVGIVGDSEWDADKPLVCGMVQTLAQRLTVYSEDQLIDQHLSAQAERERKELDNLRARHGKKKVPPKQRVEEMNQLKAQLVSKRLSDEALVQKITAKMQRQAEQYKQTLRFLHSIEFVIAEEAHESGGNGYYQIMQACKNAYYRLALTATPFMRDDAEANMRLMGCTGGVMIRVTEKQLIDCGILSRPIFMMLPTEKPKGLFKSTPYASAYKKGIVENEWRNKRIVAEAIRMTRFGLTSMILVQRVAHGQILKEYFTKLGVKVRFIKGEDSQQARQHALNQLGSNEIQVLIGTNILDVGVDVPSVGCVILAGAGKAEVANRQRIGRGLRAKKNGPNVCFILDFMDEHNSHLRDHAFQRRSIITETPGFAENLLPTGTTWDLTNYGFEKVTNGL